MILLTGATGLLGSHIAFELTGSGEKLRALKRKNASTAILEKVFRFYSENADELLARIEWVEGDLLDVGSLEDAMDGITHVYHSAAVVSFLPSDKNYLLQVNIEGTANLVNIALDSGVKKFCHVSSVAALGRTINGNTIDEDVWWKSSPDNSWYAISKYGGEREAWRATEEGMDVIILNPSLILGPGDENRSSSEVMRVLKKGNSWFTNGVTGYVDARDVAKAAVLLMKSEIKNERFIINAANLSFKEFFDKVLLLFGKPKTKYEAGSFLTGLGWRGDKIRAALTGRKASFTKETAIASQAINRFDGEKITRVLDFKYREIDETLREVCHYYKA
jgi:dihydroflavonol-4-reductase